jgi:hypothetical protein
MNRLYAVIAALGLLACEGQDSITMAVVPEAWGDAEPGLPAGVAPPTDEWFSRCSSVTHRESAETPGRYSVACQIDLQEPEELPALLETLRDVNYVFNPEQSEFVTAFTAHAADADGD